MNPKFEALQKCIPASPAGGFVADLTQKILEKPGEINPDGSELEIASEASAQLTEVRQELELTLDNIETRMVWLIIREFLDWLILSRRTSYTHNVLRSWIEIHPLEAVRELGDDVMTTVAAGTPLKFDSHIKVLGITQTMLAEFKVVVATQLGEVSPSLGIPQQSPVTVSVTS